MKNKIISFFNNFYYPFLLGVFVLGFMPVYAIADCEHHLADNEILYDWDSCVPPTLSKSDLHLILVFPYIVNEDYYEQKKTERISGEFTEKALRSSYGYGDYLSNYIMLIPYIPSNTKSGIKVAYFGSYHVFDLSIGELYYRPDFKLNLMIDRLKSSLRQDGYLIYDKVILQGISGTAIFSQCYSILNPDRVAAVAIGQFGGAMTLPEDFCDSEQVCWPYGIFNYNALTGKSFDRVAYKNIKQFFYIGTEDNECSRLSGGGRGCIYPVNMDNGIPCSGTSCEGNFFFNRYFGDTDPVRIKNQCSFLKSLGYDNIVFRQYPGVMHDCGSMVEHDVWCFTESVVVSVREGEK